MVMEPDWINTVSYTPLLRYSVLAPFLSEYIPDGVGISPTTVQHASWGGSTAGESGTTEEPADKKPDGESIEIDK